MKKLLLVLMLMGMAAAGYGQFYEPEHIWHLGGNDPGDFWFGRYMAGIGDVNRDGYDDFLVNHGTGSPDSLRVLLFYGGNPPDTIPDMVFRNPYPYGYFGYDIENAGDVNGDSFDDFAVQGNYQQDNTDRVFIYYGGPNIDTIPDVTLAEATWQDVFGQNIEGIGDVNGDGYDDLAVHAGNYGSSRGKVWVYLGGNPMDSIADWQKEGMSGIGFGRTIAGKGDLNGDIFDDFAMWEWTGYPSQGTQRFYIYFGSSDLDTLADLIIEGSNYYPAIDLSEPSAIITNLNGDQYSDLVITAGNTHSAVVFYGGNPMDTNIDLVLQGFDSNPMANPMNVSAAGDVNDDGYGDIIVSQYWSDMGYGRTMEYLGNTWMSGQPDMQWLGYNYPGVMNCGYSLADCGDVNGDGVDDIMFGSPGNVLLPPLGYVDIWAGDRAFVAKVPPGTPTPIPQVFHLLPPYPNPFNIATVISYEIPFTSDVKLSVYNILGQGVEDIINQSVNQGVHTFIWNPSSLPSGIYFCRLQAGNFVQIRKMVLLK